MTSLQGVDTIALERFHRKLVNFSPGHHEKLQLFYRDKMEWWRQECDVKAARCRTCWLRPFQCFCESLVRKRYDYLSSNSRPNVEVIMYYTPEEIGRSANTAHLLEATCPWMCKSIVYGNLEKERELLDCMEREHNEGRLKTCIMFPSKEAILLSEFMQQNYNPSPDNSNGNKIAVQTVTEGTAVQPEVRLIMLDGTYPGASREAKYLMNCCMLRGVPPPLVKLDLAQGGCKSAVAGLMYQPGKEKICTYQATIMALQQIGVDDAAFCQPLFRDLDDWIAHILTTKIKMGKSRPKACMDSLLLDNTPTELVAGLMDKYASPDKHNTDFKAENESVKMVSDASVITTVVGVASTTDIPEAAASKATTRSSSKIILQTTQRFMVWETIAYTSTVY